MNENEELPKLIVGAALVTGVVGFFGGVFLTRKVSKADSKKAIAILRTTTAMHEDMAFVMENFHNPDVDPDTMEQAFDRIQTNGQFIEMMLGID